MRAAAVTEFDRPLAEEMRDGSIVQLRSMRGRWRSTPSVPRHPVVPHIYRRFFSAHPRLTPDELYRFTHVDHRDREAVVAMVGGNIVGVGRFDRLPDSAQAEVAFVVCDEWQGRGLGTAMLRWTAQRAREVGVTTLVAMTMSDNRPMLNVFRHCGLPVTVTYDDLANVALDLSAEIS